MDNIAIFCFRNDFRLEDNPALSEAINQGFEIIPVFIYEPKSSQNLQPGGASRWWLNQSILDIDKSLKALGGRLIIKKGNTLSMMKLLVNEVSPSAVFWNRRYLKEEIDIDNECQKILGTMGVKVNSFQASLLVEPWETKNKEGNPFKVYSPFWKSIKDRNFQKVEKFDKNNIRFCKSLNLIKSDPIESLNLVSRKYDWHNAFNKYWDVSEMTAHSILDNFIANEANDYGVDRDYPSINGTSCLSPYLKWGQISPKQIVQAINANLDPSKKGPHTFIKEIYWREFAYYVMYHFPHTINSPLQEKYSNFPWDFSKATLHSWQKGMTGYPIVDAGMRQLYETGWMHNRVRMIVASFLVKHLLHSWVHGAKWFLDTLVDADPASNTLGWQWSGGCGADAAPYFRIFNPMIQGMKFDSNGSYVSKWVPELSNLPAKFIHQPWEADSKVLKQYGVILGESYPKPIIDHSFGRERALAALSKIK